MISLKHISLTAGLMVAAVGCAELGERLSVGRDALHPDGGSEDESDTPFGGPAKPGLVEYDGGSAEAGSPPVVLYETHFEAANECDAWVATNGIVSTVPGRTGNACMICSTGDPISMHMRRDFAVPGLARGVYWIEYQVKLLLASDAGLGPQATGSFTWADTDGAPSFPDNGGPDPGQWKPARIGIALHKPRAESTLGVYMAAQIAKPNGVYVPIRAGDCMVFDDLNVVLERF